MKTVHLSYQKNLGPHLRIEEKQLRWILLEELADHLPQWLDYLHCRMPEWLSDVTTAIRWGPADEDGWTEKSLNYKLYRVTEWAYCGFGAWKRQRLVGNVPLTAYEVHALFPDADPLFTGDSEDAMNSQPADEGEVTLLWKGSWSRNGITRINPPVKWCACHVTCGTAGMRQVRHVTSRAVSAAWGTLRGLEAGISGRI